MSRCRIFGHPEYLGFYIRYYVSFLVCGILIQFCFENVVLTFCHVKPNSHSLFTFASFSQIPWLLLKFPAASSTSVQKSLESRTTSGYSKSVKVLSEIGWIKLKKFLAIEPIIRSVTSYLLLYWFTVYYFCAVNWTTCILHVVYVVHWSWLRPFLRVFFLAYLTV